MFSHIDQRVSAQQLRKAAGPFYATTHSRGGLVRPGDRLLVLNPHGFVPAGDPPGTVLELMQWGALSRTDRMILLARPCSVDKLKGEGWLDVHVPALLPPRGLVLLHGLYRMARQPSGYLNVVVVVDDLGVRA